MDSILLEFPLKPISLNNAYLNNFRSGRGRFKSPEYKLFEKSMSLYVRRYKKLLETIYEGFSYKENVLCLDYYFFFPRSEIFNKDGAVKKRRWDRCNLQKIPTDIITKTLGIDDSAIFLGDTQKLISQNNKFTFFINIGIKKIEFMENISKDFYGKNSLINKI